MRWMGFGKGFGFDLNLNAWSDAARAASIEARKRTKEARESQGLLPVDTDPYYHMKKAEEAAEKAEQASEEGNSEEAAKNHQVAADIHEEISKLATDEAEHYYDDLPPEEVGRKEHVRITGAVSTVAKAHHEAAQAHAEAGLHHITDHDEEHSKVDWRPGEIMPEDYDVH